MATRFALAVSFFTILLCISYCNCTLELVTDDEIPKLVGEEQYLVVLFTGDSCTNCEHYETELIAVREDLVDSLNAYVVKIHNSQLVRKYGAETVPAIVYFRKGTPMLYEGEANDEAFLEFFLGYRESTVQDLNDENFEHLTQASSGATTGDWLIMFYDSSSLAAEALMPRLETVASKMKARINVARINRPVDGAKTARRFGVKSTPTLFYLRFGKIYKFHLPRVDIPSMLRFVNGWYRESKGDSIPPPKSPFDDFTEAAADYLRENPLVLGAILLCFLVLIVLLVLNLRKSNQPPNKKKKTK